MVDLLSRFRPVTQATVHHERQRRFLGLNGHLVSAKSDMDAHSGAQQSEQPPGLLVGR